MAESNPDIASDDDINEIAKQLGVDLDENDDEKTEKKSDSDKKIDTEAGQKEGRDSKPEKKEDQKDETDYKKKYAESTKEFQEKYKPMEDMVKNIEKQTGKKLGELLEILAKTEEKEVKPKKDTSKDNLSAEVGERLLSLEKTLDSLKSIVGEQETDRKITVNEKIKQFKDKYSLSQEDYEKKIAPLLPVMKEMKKDDGNLYSLEEGLEVAYLVANKGKIDEVVKKKLELEREAQKLTFAPGGSKSSSDIEKDKPYSEQQQEVATKMGVNLTEEKK